MGADRKGPLAAFILIAVIAAILLITSVRSQADDGLFGPDLSSPVAGGPAIGELDQAVQVGVFLVHRATSDPAGIADPTVTRSVPAASRTSVPTPSGTSTHVAASHLHPARQERGPRVPRTTSPTTRPPGRPSRRPTAPSPVQHTARPTTRPTSQPATRPGRHLGWGASHPGKPGHDHGRHLGWVKHQA